LRFTAELRDAGGIGFIVEPALCRAAFTVDLKIASVTGIIIVGGYLGDSFFYLPPGAPQATG